MISESVIDAALERLTALGPDGNLAPDELAKVMGIDFEAMMEWAGACASQRAQEIVANIVEAGVIDMRELVACIAADHTLSFITGVMAHHMASETA